MNVARYKWQHKLALECRKRVKGGDGYNAVAFLWQYGDNNWGSWKVIEIKDFFFL